MKIIKESKVRPPKRYGLNLSESLFEATTHPAPQSLKNGKSAGEKFAIVVKVDQHGYIEENGLDRTTAFTKAATVSRSNPSAYVAVISSDDARLAEFNGEKPGVDQSGEKTESLTEDADDVPVETQPAPEIGPEFGLASMLNTAIQDEWKTIDMYNSLSVTASTEGFEDIARVIDEINTEESKHVGQLQAALKTVAPNAKAIEAGEQEGENQLGSAEIQLN